MGKRNKREADLERILNESGQDLTESRVEVVETDEFHYFLKNQNEKLLKRTLVFEPPKPRINEVQEFILPPGNQPYFFDQSKKIQGYTFDTIKGKKIVFCREGLSAKLLESYGPGPFIPVPKFVKGDKSGFRRSKDVTYLALIETAFSESTKAFRSSTAHYRRLADYDVLTGILGQNAFKRDRKKHVAWGIREGAKILLVEMDLKNLSSINNIFGHAKGDEVLEAVGPALAKSFGRAGSSVYRAGGDEFVAVVYRGAQADGPRLIRIVKENISEIKVVNQFYDPEARGKNHELIFQDTDEFLPVSLNIGFNVLHLRYDDPARFRRETPECQMLLYDQGLEDIDQLFEQMFEEGLKPADDGCYAEKSSSRHLGMSSFMRSIYFKDVNGIPHYDRNGLNT